MAIERRNPLPVGRYWVDIVEPKTGGVLLKFDAWLARNSSKVKVVKREQKGTTLWSLDTSGKRYDWVLFDVLSPVEWPRTSGFGLPTIVQSPTAPTAAPVTSSADTVQRPPEPTISSVFEGFAGDVKTVALIALGLYFLMNQRK